MPNSVGVYGVPDVKDAGDEVSSTYEGRHITMLEGELIHENHIDGMVDKGDPIVVCLYNTYGTPGKAVGVAFKSAAAITDRIAVDTEGIWALTVYGENDLGNSRVTAGDPLYIDFATNQAIVAGVGYGGISKISNPVTNTLFGYALGDVASGGSGVIAVKIHWDPSVDNAKRTWYTAPDGAYAYGKHHTTIFEGGQSTGLEYFDQRVTGTQTGNIYGWGSWVEIQAGYLSLAGQLLVAGEFGMYQAGGDVTNNWIVLEQLQAILTENPTRLDIFRVNIAAAGGAAHCVIAAANPTSVGYVADAVDNGGANKLGNVPLFDIVGVGVCYVEVFSA